MDGAIRLKDLVGRAKDLGMEAAAITDHGNLYGAVNFYLAAQSVGIKPILGCEVYVAGGDHLVKNPETARDRYHLILLAQNLTGWQNLVKLVSIGHLEGFYHKPRVDKKLLSLHNEGLIAMSACLAGEIPRALMRKGMDAGLAMAKEYAAIFPDRFYLELQSNGIAEQVELNEKLIELSHETKLPLAATNDCHYLTKDDVAAHDILLCIQTASCVDDEKRMRFETQELYYKTPEEMEADFQEHPEAISNTGEIASRCNLELDLKTHHFPVYDLPEGMSIHDQFQKLCRDGLKERIAKAPYEIDEKAYLERLELEMDVIAEMGFEAYHLIVQDFINWAKAHNIPVGPGRGSAAGSLVCWALKITNLDPIPYNLLFERFLNIERVSMPDIDVDFCERRRGEVISYVTEKYGEDSVAQIATFGRMKAKAVVRDVGRALGMNFGETDRIAKLIPDEMKMTIQKAIDIEPELTAIAKEDPRVARLLDVSKRLEGLARHSSTHAAGVVIGDKPLTEYLPLYRGKKKEVVTQFDMKMVEKVGLIKFDFLGLRTMTLIQDTLDNIAKQGKDVPDLEALDLDVEPATYKIYSTGDTDGVFQVESSGMRRYLRQLKPSCFDDLIAMLALYRPGPLGSGMVDEFIKRKHGEVEVTYPHELLEDTLRATYGVIVYQEQVMRIAQVIAGYTLGGADLLRRAMGKKNAEAMAAERIKFVQGAAAKDIGKDKANEIFDLMEKFAEYGFNKSHSAAYALISFYTAYLKAHYRVEFMAALLTSELGNQEKALKYITTCRDASIEVRPPDVNASFREFTVRDRAVVFGLGGVKNVGDEAIREIVEAREGTGEHSDPDKQAGPFVSLLDLCVRVNLRKVTKRVLEHLIKAGALDSLGCSRQSLFAALDAVVSRAQKRAKERDSNQMSLFTMVDEEIPVRPGVGFECEEEGMEEWEDAIKSRFEKDGLGFFLTSHPLTPFRSKMERLDLATLAEIKEMGNNTEVRTALVIAEKKERFNKKGEKWAACQGEDLTGMIEVLVFQRAYADIKDILDADKPLMVDVLVREEEGGGGGYGGGPGNGYGGAANGGHPGPEPVSAVADDEDTVRQVKLIVNSATLLEDMPEPEEQPLKLTLAASRFENGGLARFKELLAAHPGRAPVRIKLKLDDMVCELELGPDFRVSHGQELDRALDEWLRSDEPAATEAT